MKIIRSLSLAIALLVPAIAMASDSSCSRCDHCPAGCPCCHH